MDFDPVDSFAPRPGNSGAEDELDPMDAFAPSPGAPDEDSDDSEGPEFEPIEDEEEEEVKEHRPSPSGVNVVDEVPSSINSAAIPKASSQLDAAEVMRSIIEETLCPLCRVEVSFKNAKQHLDGRKHKAAAVRHGIPEAATQISAAAAPAPKNGPSQAKKSYGSAPTPTEGSEQSEEPLYIDMLDSSALKMFIASVKYCPLCVTIAADEFKLARKHVDSRMHRSLLEEHIRIAGMQQRKNPAEGDADRKDGPMGTHILLGKGAGYLPDNLRECLCRCRCQICPDPFNSRCGLRILRHYNSTKHQAELHLRGLPTGLVVTARPISHRRQSTGQMVFQVPEVRAIIRMRTEGSRREGEDDKALMITKFTGKGATDIPLNLRSLYMSGSCLLCEVSFDNYKVILEHYNTEEHQRQLDQQQLPIGSISFVTKPTFSAQGDDRVLKVPLLKSPPFRFKRLTGKGAPNLPENLRELILNRYCRLCVGYVAKDMLNHYNNIRHQARLDEEGLPYGTVHLEGPLRPFTSKEGEHLVEVPMVSTPPKPKPATFTGPGAKDLPDNAAELIRTLYCTHCCYSLENEIVAIRHYNGSRHQVKLEKAQLPVVNATMRMQIKMRWSANGERVVYVPPLLSRDPPIQRLTGEGAKDVPDNLRELLFSFRCHLCATDLRHVTKVFHHYNSPSHMTKLKKANLPQIRALVTDNFSRETVDGENVLVVPPIQHELWGKTKKLFSQEK